MRANEILNEALITFHGKAYPKFGQVVILAGGAGSGKGFALEKAIGIEGKVMDVDALKSMALKSASKRPNSKVNRLIAKATRNQVDLGDLDLSNPDDVSFLHVLFTAPEINFIKKHQSYFVKSAQQAHPERLPNLIMDVTLKSISKISNISRMVTDLGYEKENIHIVWVLNDVDIASKQNRERNRVVPEDILFDTHEGAAITLFKILDMGKQLTQYMDGDIWILFNNRENEDLKMKSSGRGGSYVEKMAAVKVKDAGFPPSIPDLVIADDIANKIIEYTPRTRVNPWQNLR